MIPKRKPKVAVIFGTRPEAIKLAPIILGFRAASAFECQVCVTGQHREMLDQVLEVFGIVPDTDLRLMKKNQTLGELSARAIQSIDLYLTETKPDMVLVQGDTTTVFCAALAAFYHRIPVGHVEAGLRTWNMQSPWPEEANRVLTSRLAALHFAPTERSRKNLLKEGVLSDDIYVTGNTVIDALFLATEKIKANVPVIPGLPPQILCNQRLVLITGHRRENFGVGFENICRAIAALAKRFPEAQFVYPVHLNPNVQEPVSRILGAQNRSPHSHGQSTVPSHSMGNIHLIEPVSYLPFVALMKHAHIVLTDSGGIQEEAPSLGKPVLVMRDTTERPEGVECGAVRLVGTCTATIVSGVSELLTDSRNYAKMVSKLNPYGDGHAAEKILQVCYDFLTKK